MKLLIIAIFLFPLVSNAGSIERRIEALEDKVESLVKQECTVFEASGTVLGGAKAHKANRQGGVSPSLHSIRTNFEVIILRKNIIKDIYNHHSSTPVEKNVKMAVVRMYAKPCVSLEGTWIVRMEDIIEY
jgi:hypothetical protein